MCISPALEVSYISNTYNSPGGKIMTGAPVSIDHLPNELTSKIFSLSCQPPKFGEKPDDYFCPLILGAVCRSWREVAWDLPKLWSYIGLVISLDSWEIQLDLVDEWLARSKKTPLCISVHCTEEYKSAIVDEGDNSEDLGLWDIFERVVSESTRIEALDVVLMDENCAEMLHEAAEKHLLGSLRRLSLVVHSRQYSSVKVTMLVHLSSLTHFFFFSRGNGSYQLPYLLSNIQLTAVRLDSVEFGAGIKFLKGAPNLRSCYFLHMGSEYEGMWGEPFNFLHLETLVASVSISRGIFNRFKAVPKLRHLVMDGGGCHQLSVLKQFFEKHKFKLETLHLAMDRTMKVEDLRGVLQRQTSLTKLTIHKHGFDRKLVSFHDGLHKCLAAANDAETLLPNLREYEYYVNRDVPMASVAEMLRTRWQSLRDAGQLDPSLPRPFLSARLQSDSKEEVTRLLATEIAQGLRVSFDLYCEGLGECNLDPTIEP